MDKLKYITESIFHSRLWIPIEIFLVLLSMCTFFGALYIAAVVQPFKKTVQRLNDVGSSYSIQLRLGSQIYAFLWFCVLFVLFFFMVMTIIFVVA